MAERPCARVQCEPDGGAKIWYLACRDEPWPRLFYRHTTLAFARISV